MQYYCEEKEEVLEQLNVTESGLTIAEAEEKLELDGKNKLAKGKGKSLLARFLEAC